MHPFLPMGFALLLAVPTTILAQVADTNTKPHSTLPLLSSNPSHARTVHRSADAHFLRVGSWTYFTASTPKHGTELYRSNGTATTRLTDLNPGPMDSSPGNLTQLAGRIYFSAYTPMTGHELFVYDPVVNKARLFADFLAGPAGSYPAEFAQLADGKIVCRANSGNGYEPHVSDGTSAGTMELRDIYRGTGNSDPSYLTSTGDGKAIFFSARSIQTGTELWQTNGTVVGTSLVLDIQAGSGSSMPRYLRPIGANRVHFQAWSAATGTEGWLSDGSLLGTQVIDDWPGKDSGVQSYYTSAMAVNGQLIYAGRSAATGTELFITNASLATTVLLKDLSPGKADTSIYQMIRAREYVYICLRKSSGEFEMWRSDGTSAGTTRFATSPGMYPSNLFYSGSRLYWCAFISRKGYELCYSDGTAAGTGYKDLNLGPLSSFPFYGTELRPGTAMFRARDRVLGYEPHFITGLSIRTLDLAKVTEPITQSDRVHSITEHFGKVLFSATNGNDGNELWSSAGTEASTVMVKDIHPGSASGISSYNMHAARLGNYVYFAANDGSLGNELWRSKGTSTSTKLFADLHPGAIGSNPSHMTRIGTKIFFNAYLHGMGQELCITDGKTVTSIDIFPGSASSYPMDFAALDDGKVVFRARGTKGYELYIYDGVGVSLLKDLWPGPNSSHPSGLTTWNGRVYFSAYTETMGRELWVTSGTNRSTFLLKNIASDQGGIQSSNPRAFAANASVVDRLYFTAYTATQLNGMWHTTGATSSTAPWFHSPLDVNPEQTTQVGSRSLYFSANSKTGITLHRVDPADGLIHPFAINKGGHAWPSNYTNGRYQFCVEGGSVWFSAKKGDFDIQLYRTAAHGATATPIGEVRGQATIRCTDPVLGKSMRVSGKSMTPNLLNVLIVGTPSNNPMPASGGYYFYHSWSPLLVLASSTSQSWSSAFLVPNKSSLIGQKAVLQNWALDLKAFPAGWSLSNGIHLTMGN